MKPMTLDFRHNDPAQVRQLYSHFTGYYDSFDALWKLPYRKAYLALDRAFEAHLPPNGRILDLGCGTGLNVERLSALGLPFSSYVGIDLSEAMLARAQARFSHVEKIRFEQADLAQDALPEGPFDFIVSTWALERLSDPVSVVERAGQRLAPGGYLALLFMVRKRWVKLVAPAARLVNAPISYGVEEDACRRFPGIVSIDRFGGGTAALAILQKPENESRHG
jgi:SAM-dependent methyltransferase